MSAAQTLRIRLAEAGDFATLEALVIDSFEPITWQKKLDDTIGPLNGRTWRDRWTARLKHIFATQIVLVGEVETELTAMASANIDAESALAFVDVLCVSRKFQGRGYGGEMLRGAMDHYRRLGCKYVHLDCLADNEAGNALYASHGFQEVARHIRWFRQLD
jgi:ribosomal protein S18 acetylase RimI-like enzyme